MQDNQIGILGRFQLLLEIEGFNANIIKSNDNGVPDTLIVNIDDPDTDRNDWELELRFLPATNNDMNPRLQFFSNVCDAESILSNFELIRFVMALNTQLPMIGFHCSEASNLVFFNNFTALTMDQPIGDDQIVTDSVHMCAYILNTFGPMVIQVARGDRKAEELLEPHLLNP